MRAKLVGLLGCLFGLVVFINSADADEVIFKVGNAHITRDSQKYVSTYTSEIRTDPKATKTQKSEGIPVVTGTSTAWKPVIETISPKPDKVFLIVECSLNGNGKDIAFDHTRDFLLVDEAGTKMNGVHNTGNYYSGGKGSFKKVKTLKMRLLYSIHEKTLGGLKIEYAGKDYPVTISSKKR